MTNKFTSPSVIHNKNVSKKRPLSDRPHALKFEVYDKKKSCMVPELTKTQMHQQHDADINTIMDKYAKTGVLTVNPALPQYGDYSNPISYQNSLQLVINAEAQFNALPPKIRERFANDPAKFLTFCEDENNKSEMEALGLLPKTKKAPAAPPSPPETAPKAKPEAVPENKKTPPKEEKPD